MPLLKYSTTSQNPPKNYTQKSRKGKKSWRKNIDFTAIEYGLEELQEELIQGGVIVEKTSEDLFTVDKCGDVTGAKKIASGSKVLKSTQIIAHRSLLPAISTNRRPIEKNSNLASESKRQRTSYVSHRELNRLKTIAKNHQIKLDTEIGEAAYDLWSTTKDGESTLLDPKFSFLKERKERTIPKTLREKSISLAASGKEIPAVSKPKSAYSYNPLADDYVLRLQALGQREVEAEKKRLAAIEAEKNMLEAAAKSAAESEATETKVDLSEWEEDSSWEGFESGVEDKKLSLKRPGRKTQAQRNKIKRRKEEERKAKLSYAIKRKNEQVAQVRKIIRELDMKQNHKQLRALNSESFSDDGMESDFELRKRKLGKIRPIEKDLELVLPDELQESLRLLKPEGNLLKDRYRNLLVRGKFECRKPIIFAKKPNRKVTEKWIHKDFLLH